MGVGRAKQCEWDECQGCSPSPACELATKRCLGWSQRRESKIS